MNELQVLLCFYQWPRTRKLHSYK